MKTSAPLLIDSFERKEVGQGVYYLQADAGDYDITIEPHLTAGFSVAIYRKRSPFVAVKKRAVWKYNHPAHGSKPEIEKELFSKALEIAQYYYEFYYLENTEATPPMIGDKPIIKDNRPNYKHGKRT